MSEKININPENSAQPEQNEDTTLQNVVFEVQRRNGGKIEYRSSAPDRKIVILSESSVKPEPGVSYRVKVIEDSDPNDPKSGKLIVEIVPIQEGLRPITETADTITYLGVVLEKAKAPPSGFVPERDKIEQFYVNDPFALRLQQKIAIAMKQGQNLLIEGGTAIGKTTTVAKMCAELGYELHYVNLNGQTDVENLMGKYIPNINRKQKTDPEFQFADGSVTSGLRKETGKIKVIVLDEVNATNPGTLKRLNEVLNAVEQGGTVVLTEDASERIRVDKETTKVIALMNPSGQGYLGVNPLSKELINRFVYQKEADELPQSSFGFRLKAKTNRGPRMGIMGADTYINDPRAVLTYEQYGEIPGIDIIEKLYEEFHFAAKEMLKLKKISEDQNQLFLFDDQRESDRVINYVLNFYTGDVNEAFRRAIEFYYINKLESETDKKALRELLAKVHYEPPKSGSKRRGLEKEKVEEKKEAGADLEIARVHLKEIEEIRAKLGIKTETAKSSLESQEQLKSWKKFYQEEFDKTLDISKLTIPEKKEGFDRLVVVMEGLTLNEITEVLKRRFPVFSWTTDLDANTPTNDRDAKKEPYAIWIKDAIEADENLKNISANDLAKKKIQTITLKERLLLEAMYFKETGKHLDETTVTLCAGSRYSDGLVPVVSWGGGELGVVRFASGYANDILRARAVVS